MDNDGFEFRVDRAIGGINKVSGYKHLTRLPYEKRAQKDHEEAGIVISNVIDGILRSVSLAWVGGKDQFIAEYLQAYNDPDRFVSFNIKTWNAINASEWLNARDCESPEDELWQYAMVLIMETVFGSLSIGADGSPLDFGE